MQIIENNAKACLSMQRCNMKVAPFHNSREGFVPETSRPELAKKNKCSCSALAALKKIQEWDQKADAAYARTHGGRKSPVKEENKCWEAVINLNSRHTMSDVKKLVKKLEKITGYRAAQVAIHKDEGHLDEETGNFVLNVHAHVIFYARDVKTGLSLSTANYGRKDLMTKMQDAVAEELGMERGRPVEETGRKHLSPRAYKAQKRQEAAIAQNNKEWEARKAEWEAKQAEREAQQAEWERKLPEIMARKEQYSKFVIDKIDWEAAKTGKKLAYEMEMLGLNFAGVSNPNGNILLEAQKDAIRNVFKMLGVTAQLAVFLLNKTLANDEKIKSDAKIYNVESTLLRAVDYVANSDPDNAEELKKRIRLTLMKIPADKQEELFQYAIENAPTPELKNDILALIEGRFSDIAKSEAAQRRIENRDLRQALKEYAAEAKRIKDELKEMDEENRILVAAERALLREKGAGREEYAEQEAQNRERLNELSELKQQAKDLNNAIRDQKQSPDKDAETIKRQAEKIAKLTAQIAQITAENAKKQRELEEELEQEKAKRKEAEIISPKMLETAFEKIDELEERLKQREEPKIEKQPEPEQKPKDAFDIIAELESAEKAKQPKPEPVKPEPIREEQKPEPIREEPKIEQKPELKIEKPEPEPIAKKADNLNIFGYERYVPEPRRHRFDYEPRRPREDDRPKYEPEKQPEPEPIFRDPWAEIESDLQIWKTREVAGEKALIAARILHKLDDCEKNGEMNNDEKREYARRVRYALNMLDPFKIAEQEAEARKNAETQRKVADIHRELESKHKQAEIQNETTIKYEDVKAKNVRKEDETRQRTLKKKKKDELEMGMS